MTAAWQGQLATGIGDTLQGLVTRLARPAAQRGIRLFVVALLLLWLIRSLVLALWSLVPVAAPLPAEGAPINPALPAVQEGSQSAVDIEALVAAGLFGTAGEGEAVAVAEEVPPLTEAEAAGELAGIEDNARETGLPLRLSGVVAASEAGLGQAIIEYRNTQELYRVGDELPVSGRVVLAKVLPKQVVIDNEGRYELLKLFDDSDPGFRPAAPAARRSPPAPQTTGTPGPGARGAGGTAATAARYREQLYADPQSLAEVVSLTAVRNGDELLGYRLRPGQSADDFRDLGFRSGDLVTAINGLPLSDPGNTLRLYRAMRSAGQAVFDLRRGDETLTLTVNLETAQ